MHKLKLLVVTAAAIVVSACSGGSDETLTGTGGGGGGGGGGGVPGSQDVRIGNGFGSAFQEGVLEVGVANLAAGGSTGVTATFVTESGDLFAEAVTVAFNSACAAQGLATITTPIATTTGIANATYVASGCSGGDVVTATATVNGSTMSANTTITVAPASVGSIQFISATPTNIALQGTGGAGRSETSTVIFRVVDSTGGPVANANVQFSLNTTIGGTTLSPTQSTTNFSGHVQTVVTSGTVATTVRVTAVVVGSSIGTQSDQLTITTGIPDQDSVSLSIEVLNPEAWNIDGVVDPVTIRLSDRFNNPVPDGTAITFTTEGAQIESQCLTTAGACSVDWTSQQPRPTDGRVTILATAIGEESFVDVDGNGRYGAGDTFTDIPEPFRDDDENGTRASTEPFHDFNVNGTYDGADGEFNGLLCDTVTPAGDCSTTSNSVAVNDSLVMVMSGCDVVATGLPASVNAPGSVGALFSDFRDNPLPLGTTIEFETTNGTIVGPGTFAYPNTITAQSYSAFVNGDGTASSGPLFITITCPSGLAVTLPPITVND